MKKLIYLGLAIFLLFNLSLAAQETGVVVEIDTVPPHKPHTSTLECGDPPGDYDKLFKSTQCYCKDEDKIPDMKTAKDSLAEDVLRSLICIDSCGPNEECFAEILKIKFGDNTGKFKMDIVQDKHGNTIAYCSTKRLRFTWKCTDCEHKSSPLSSDFHDHEYEAFATKSNLLLIHPNPTNGLFNVDIRIPKDQQTARVVIIDASSRVVKDQVFKADSTHQLTAGFDFSAEPTGIYFITIYAKDKVLETQKIIVKR